MGGGEAGKLLHVADSLHADHYSTILLIRKIHFNSKLHDSKGSLLFFKDA